LPRLTSRRRCARLWRSILFPSSPDPRESQAGGVFAVEAWIAAAPIGREAA
jgi:hypothetical protein